MQKSITQQSSVTVRMETSALRQIDISNLEAPCLIETCHNTAVKIFKTKIDDTNTDTIKLLPENKDQTARCFEPYAWFNEVITLLVQNLKLTLLSLIFTALSPLLIVWNLVVACLPKSKTISHLVSAIVIVPLTVLSCLLFSFLTLLTLLLLVLVVCVVVGFLVILGVCYTFEGCCSGCGRLLTQTN